jgi:hypothetical protein
MAEWKAALPLAVSEITGVNYLPNLLDTRFREEKKSL